MYTRKNLRIAIIGSGIGGLTCALSLAHHGFRSIHVFEAAPKLDFVGAGIQLAPNMARILDRLGVWDELQKNAVTLEQTQIRDGPTNLELARVDNTSAVRLYGYPHLVAHRADLIESMFNACSLHAPTVRFHFGTSVEQVLSFGPTPTLRAVPLDGAAYDAPFDVVLACDGIKSKVRKQMLQKLHLSSSVQDTGYAAYRIILKREQLQHDPELQRFVSRPQATRWIGPNRHIVAYPVSNHTLYNIVTVQPDINFADAPSATYTTKGSKQAMLSVYSDFDLQIQRLLSLAPDEDVLEWKLCVHEPLPTWVYGNVALVGDVCHPTLPFLAQGAAQAVEDAGVLGSVLSQMVDQMPRNQSINNSLHAYGALRKERAETIVNLATENGRILHMSDGAEKTERNRQFKEGGGTAVPDKWMDAQVQEMVFAHDCVFAAQTQYARLNEVARTEKPMRVHL